MIVVDNIPETIHGVLNDFSTWFFTQDRSTFDYGNPKGYTLTKEQATSVDYLQEQQRKQLCGYPQQTWGVDMCDLTTFDLDVFYHELKKADCAVQQFLNARNCAIKMYYPAQGYIDWHTNSNAFGYNVLLTYSVTGDGAFLYQNPTTKEIVSIPDKQGWNMKVGVYDVAEGSPLWHAAYTNCERLTWGYILDELGWQNLVEECNIDTKPLAEMMGSLPTFRD